jgi:hypothetical protein
MRTVLGGEVRHRDSQYLNNRLEQDHRGVKGRYGPMRGFKCPRRVPFSMFLLPRPTETFRRLPQVPFPSPTDTADAGIQVPSVSCRASLAAIELMHMIRERPVVADAKCAERHNSIRYRDKPRFGLERRLPNLEICDRTVEVLNFWN